MPPDVHKVNEADSGVSETLGLKLEIYQHDILILNAQKEVLQKQVNSVIWLLTSLGFVINLEKLIITPSQVEFFRLCTQFTEAESDASRRQSDKYLGEVPADVGTTNH